MAFRSTFDPKEVDPERQVIFEESRIETDNPRSGIVRQLYGMVFAGNPYGRPVLGHPATMSAATQDNLKAFNRRYYTPENMALVVVGPVDPDAMRGDGRPHLRPAPPHRIHAAGAPARAPQGGSAAHGGAAASSRPSSRSAGRRPRSDDARRRRLDLLATILGGTESSRLAPRFVTSERIVSRSP